MARSEALAALLHLEWCRRHGLGPRATLPAHGADGIGRVDDRLLARALDDLDAFARRWAALDVGGTVTEPWLGTERTTAGRRRRSREA